MYVCDLGKAPEQNAQLTAYGKIKTPRVFPQRHDELNGVERITRLGRATSALVPDELNPLLWRLRSEPNHTHGDFQSPALPTEQNAQLTEYGKIKTPRVFPQRHDELNSVERITRLGRATSALIPDEQNPLLWRLRSEPNHTHGDFQSRSTT